MSEASSLKLGSWFGRSRGGKSSRENAGFQVIVSVTGAVVKRWQGMTNDQAPMTNPKANLVIGIWSLVI
jgi:hypothetical protein